MGNEALESRAAGHLGVLAVNTANEDIVEHRADDTFPTGCTSKVIGVAAVLKQSMSDPALLLTRVYYAKEALVDWSPVTRQHVADGMTVQALCAAAISFSDNTAMNLLLKTWGGVQGMNDFARSIGNTSFRQDNNWPAEAFSGGMGNVKDTSTPRAMVKSLRQLTLGQVLGRPQRDLFTTWLIETQTGAARIKSAVPDTWIVGHKTGTGGAYGSTHDLAIVWPPQHEPILMGIYYTTYDQHADNREDIVSAAAKMVIQAFVDHDPTLHDVSVLEPQGPHHG